MIVVMVVLEVVIAFVFLQWLEVEGQYYWSSYWLLLRSLFLTLSVSGLPSNSSIGRSSQLMESSSSLLLCRRRHRLRHVGTKEREME